MGEIREFLTVLQSSGYGYGESSGSGHGSGYGSGSGYGYSSGSGHGSGYGSGYGYGSGHGSGYGSGYGSGSGYGLQYYNGHEVHLIDSVPTVLLKVRGNIAKGYIINKDLTTEHCFVVKNDKYFAHGDSVKLAYVALQDKIIANMSCDERLAEFNAKFASSVDKYSATDLFDWHGKLTGSCQSGRKAFVYNKCIDLSTAKFSIPEFIIMTINEYGGGVIKALKDSRRL